MHVPLRVSLGLAVLLMLDVPVQAGYLLNCRLMDPATADYKRYCMGQLGLTLQCPKTGVCIIKTQNFKSAYSTEATPAKASTTATSAKQTNGSPLGGLGPSGSGLASNALSGVGSAVTGAATTAGGLVRDVGSTVGSVVGRVAP